MNALSIKRQQKKAVYNGLGVGKGEWQGYSKHVDYADGLHKPLSVCTNLTREAEHTFFNEQLLSKLHI